MKCVSRVFFYWSTDSLVSSLHLPSMPVWCWRNPPRRLWQADRSLFVSAGHHWGSLWLLQSWTLWLLSYLRGMSLLLLHAGFPETKLQPGSGEPLFTLPYSSRGCWWSWRLGDSYPCSGGQSKSDPGFHLPSTQHNPKSRRYSVTTGQAKVSVSWLLLKMSFYNF